MREKSHSSRKLLCISKPFFSVRVHDGQSWKKVTVSWTRNLSTHPTHSLVVLRSRGTPPWLCPGAVQWFSPVNIPTEYLARQAGLAGRQGWGLESLTFFIPVPYQSQISNLSRKSLSATRPCEGPCSLSPKKNPRGPGQQGAGSLSRFPFCTVDSVWAVWSENFL